MFNCAVSGETKLIPVTISFSMAKDEEQRYRQMKERMLSVKNSLTAKTNRLAATLEVRMFTSKEHGRNLVSLYVDILSRYKQYRQNVMEQQVKLTLTCFMF